MSDTPDLGREAGVTVILNDVATTLVGHPFMSLADALRQHGATGTKIGCDAGDCGACTVVMNGAPVCACLVPSIQAGGADIVTVECNDALAQSVKSAFLANGAAQCGICTPGMIMAARALIVEAQRPSRAQIENAIGGVLCRCTGYAKIIDAIASIGAPPSARGSADGAVGRRVDKVDGSAIVNGTLGFGADKAPARCPVDAGRTLAACARTFRAR